MGVGEIDLMGQGRMLGERWASASAEVAKVLLAMSAGKRGLQSQMEPLKQDGRYHERVSRNPQQSQWPGLQLQGAAWSDGGPKSWRDGLQALSGADGELNPKM